MLLRVVDSLHAEVRIVQVPLLSQFYLCILLEMLKWALVASLVANLLISRCFAIISGY